MTDNVELLPVPTRVTVTAPAVRAGAVTRVPGRHRLIDRVEPDPADADLRSGAGDLLFHRPAVLRSPLYRLVQGLGSVIRVGSRVLLAGVLVLLVLLLAAGVVGYTNGMRAAVVRSGSMQPTLHVGDLVISRPVPAQQLRPGQLVTFADANAGERAVTHRVVSVSTAGSLVNVVTKGDSNTNSEHWSVAQGHMLGLTVLHIRGVGTELAWLGTPLARALAVLVFATIVLTLIVRRIWYFNDDRAGRHAYVAIS